MSESREPEHLIELLDGRLRSAAALRQVALAVSGQAEDTLLMWRVASLKLDVHAFMLDTLRLHSETLNYISVVEKALGRPVQRLRPKPGSVALLEAAQGMYGMYDSLDQRQQCCRVRKVEVLRPYLSGFRAWITGQRRVHSASRSALHLEEVDTTFGLIKFNPLFDLETSELMSCLSSVDAPPLHPLYARGFKSIGCEPCTRPVRPDDDERAGRWWWESSSAKECGLHQSPAEFTRQGET